FQTLVALGDPGKAVDLLLTAQATPAEFSQRDNQTESPYGLAISAQGPIFGQWASDARLLRAWWGDLHLKAQTSIMEKMTFFWSGHFTTQFDLGQQQYVVAPLLYRQNKLLRANALGNF